MTLPPSAKGKLTMLSNMSVLLEAATERASHLPLPGTSNNSSCSSDQAERNTATKAEMLVLPSAHEEATSEGSHSCHSPLAAATAPSVHVPSSVYIRTSKDPRTKPLDESSLLRRQVSSSTSSNNVLVSPPSVNAQPVVAAKENNLEQFSQVTAAAAQPLASGVTSLSSQDPNALAQALLTMCRANPALLANQNEQVIKDLLILFGGNPSSPHAIPSSSTSAAPARTGEVKQQGETGTSVQEVNKKNDAVRSTIVRVACRARGMPPDHCSQSAYFFLHPELPHGADLLCCYPSCRAAGVKFRYCKVCHVPAAKRSFLFRHSHNNDEGRSFSKSSPTTAAFEASAQNIKSGGKEAPATPPLDEIEKGTTNGQAKKPRTERGPSSVSSSSSENNNCQDDPKESEWMQLLHERPNDNDEDQMSRWLLRAMHVSKSIRSQE